MCIFGRARKQFNSFWGDDAEETLHRFESDFEQKSEIFWTQIWTKSVRNLSDFAPRVTDFSIFGKFGMFEIRFLVENWKVLVRFQSDLEQKWIRFLFEIFLKCDRNLFVMRTSIKTKAQAWMAEKVWWNVYVNLQDFLKIPIRVGMEIWLISVRNLIQIYEISTRFGEFWGSENLKKRKDNAKKTVTIQLEFC